MIGTANPLIDLMRGYDPHVDGERLDALCWCASNLFYTSGCVANLLIGMCLDADTVITALLHDTVEDCGVELGTLAEQFGDDVAQLVDGVIKLSRIAIQSSPSSAQAENFRNCCWQ